MKFTSLFEFTEAGLVLFEKAFTGQIGEEAVDLNDPAIVTPVTGTRPLEVAQFDTAPLLLLRFLRPQAHVNCRSCFLQQASGRG